MRATARPPRATMFHGATSQWEMILLALRIDDPLDERRMATHADDVRITSAGGHRRGAEGVELAETPRGRRPRAWRRTRRRTAVADPATPTRAPVARRRRATRRDRGHR